MFAIFLHESMTPFHQTVTSFPTVIYTVLLIVCALYWIVAVAGIVDIEILDMDLDGDIDAADSDSIQEGIAGLLHRLGLAGVPLTIIVTLISIIGWLLCYYSTFFGATLVPNFWPIKLVVGLIVFFVATYIAILVTAQLIKPLRAMFKKLDYDETKYILGQVVIVRSGLVDKKRGEAELNDGGAGLILNIRATGGDTFSKGDEVVVVEYIEETNLYRVVSKAEFGTID